MYNIQHQSLLSQNVAVIKVTLTERRSYANCIVKVTLKTKFLHRFVETCEFEEFICKIRGNNKQQTKVKAYTIRIKARRNEKVLQTRVIRLSRLINDFYQFAKHNLYARATWNQFKLALLHS